MSPGPTFALLNSSQVTIPPPYSAEPPPPSNLRNISRSPQASAPFTSKLQSLIHPRNGIDKKKKGIISRYAGLWRAVPPALAAVFWSAQMIYFLAYFVSRPAEPDGSWARISQTYATFPFISCIGSVRELSFKTVSIIVACLLWTAFGIDWFIGARSSVGRRWRLAKLILASISNVFLIALSFATVDEHHDLHLIFTSFQICCMGLCKLCDWQLNQAMRARTPNNRHLKRIRTWKRIPAIIATPSGLMAMIGIYGCTATYDTGDVVFTPTCWTLVSFAAPSEWILSWCWVVFLGTIAYDLAYLDHTVHLLLTTPPPPPSTKSRLRLAFWRSWKRKEQGFRRIDEEESGQSQTMREVETEVYPLTGIGSGSRPDAKIRRSMEQMPEQQLRIPVSDDAGDFGLLPPTMPRSVLAIGGDGGSDDGGR